MNDSTSRGKEGRERPSFTGAPRRSEGRDPDIAVVTCALWYPSVAYCCRTAPVRPRDVVSMLLAPAAASIAAGAALPGFMRLLPHAACTPVQLAVDLVVFLALYGTAWLIIPGGRQSLGRFAALGREALGLQLQGNERPRS